MLVTVWVGLMRAVNVGGRMLPMKDAVAVASAAGCRDPRTYLQSGNIVFSGTAKVAAGLSDALSAAAGFDVPVLLRTAAEMAAVVVAQPMPGPETAWHVTFLDRAPAAIFDAAPYAPDSFVVAGREVYLRVSAGYGRSKLSNALFERKLGAVATTRNWRTVCALRDLAAAAG